MKLNDKCITCQTNEPNPMISPNFCSRICQNIWLRTDFEWSSRKSIKKIALEELEYIKTNHEKN